LSPPIEKKYWVSETVLGSQAVLIRHHSIQLEINVKEKSLKLTGHPSQGQQHVFFQLIIHFTIFGSIELNFQGFEHIQLEIIQLKNRHNLEWEAMDKFGRNDMSRLLSTVQKWRQLS